MDQRNIEVYQVDQKKFSNFVESIIGRRIEIRDYDHIIISPKVCLITKEGAFIKPGGEEENPVFELAIFDKDWIKRCGTLDIKQHSTICIGSILVDADFMVEFAMGFGEPLDEFFPGLPNNPVIMYLNE